LTVH
jgi:hypothetical protein